MVDEAHSNQRKLKALFVGPTPPPYSGPEIGMSYFLRSSLTEKLDLSYLKTNFRKKNADKGRIDASLFVAFFRFIFGLTGSILRHRPDVVYYPVTATLVGWLGRDIWAIAISRIMGARVVIHLRAGHFRLSFDKCAAWQKAVIRFACCFVSIALVQADRLKNQFTGIIPDDRLFVLHNAIDSDLYTDSGQWEKVPKRVLFMGFLTYAKGYCDLLQAIPAVADKHPDVQFIFCGERFATERNVFYNQATGERLVFKDPDDMFRRYVKNRYEQNVVFPGVVSGDRKMEYLESAAMFVLPSYSEGFSMAVLEAMCMGKPVVCTPVGAMPEVVQDQKNGFIVPPGDENRLAGAILRLLDEPETGKRIGEYNARYVRERFDVEIIAEKLLHCLELSVNM